MKGFIHNDPNFADLLVEVSIGTGGRVSPAFVEKDYWVTATLAVLETTGLDVWFKGGTSLLKGFGLIQRFSEDLDLKIAPTERAPLPLVTSWKNASKTATKNRREYFEALLAVLSSAGLSVDFLPALQEPLYRTAAIACRYPGHFLSSLDTAASSHILLEIGNARVEPYIVCTISSFVHDHLGKINMLRDYIDNRPKSIRCLNPVVTLLEKIDAISRRYSRGIESFSAPTFVRHYEDAAKVIRSIKTGPEFCRDFAAVKSILKDMELSDGFSLPKSDDACFLLAEEEQQKRLALENAHAALKLWYWGERIPLAQACQEIRGWLDEINV